MDDDAKQQTLLSALVTEHFVLQSARGVATSEAGTRASLFLTSLTGALVALGFIAQVGEQFDASPPPCCRRCSSSVSSPTPAAGEQHRGCAPPAQHQRIRRYYLALHPDAAEFFGDAADGPGRQAPTVSGGLGRVAGQVMYHSWVQLLVEAWLPVDASSPNRLVGHLQLYLPVGRTQGAGLPGSEVAAGIVLYALGALLLALIIRQFRNSARTHPVLHAARTGGPATHGDGVGHWPAPGRSGS
jgi:hypothetical protein